MRFDERLDHYKPNVTLLDKIDKKSQIVLKPAFTLFVLTSPVVEQIPQQTKQLRK